MKLWNRFGKFFPDAGKNALHLAKPLGTIRLTYQTRLSNVGNYPVDVPTTRDHIMSDRPVLGGFSERGVQSSVDDADVYVAERNCRRPGQNVIPRRPDAAQAAASLVLKIKFKSGERGAGDLKKEFAESNDCRLRVSGHHSFGGSWRSG